MAIMPPDCSAKPRATDRPNPVPRPRGFVEKNGSAAWAKVSPSIPGPLSITSNLT